jgi:hypothetical protein
MFLLRDRADPNTEGGKGAEILRFLVLRIDWIVNWKRWGLETRYASVRPVELKMSVKHTEDEGIE